MLVEYRPSFQNPAVMSQWPVFIQSYPPSNREISPHVSIFAIENWFETSVFVTAGVWDCYFGLTHPTERLLDRVTRIPPVPPTASPLLHPAFTRRAAIGILASVCQPNAPQTANRRRDFKEKSRCPPLPPV